MLRLPEPAPDGPLVVEDDEVEGPGSGPPPIPAIPAGESAPPGLGRLVENVQIPDPPKRSKDSLNLPAFKFREGRQVDPVPAGSFVAPTPEEPADDLPSLPADE